MNEQTQTIAQPNDQLTQDFKNASFIVSLFINLTLFVTWLTVMISHTA